LRIAHPAAHRDALPTREGFEVTVPNHQKKRIDVTLPPDEALSAARAALLEPIPENQRMLRDRVGNELFRNGVFVRITRDDDDEPILVRHTHHTLRELLAQRAEFGSLDRRGEWSVVDVPGSIVSQIIDAPDVLAVPIVNQIVNAPVFGPNGELHTEPGLLAEARVWYEATDAMKLLWDVPEHPTQEHISLALQWIDGIFCEFPFASKADYANALALLLQPFLRPMIDGPTPLFDVEAPTAGTGKGKLVKAALLPAMGYAVAAHPEPAEGDEWRKHIVAFLLKGKPVFFLDNVMNRLASSTLSSALTESTIDDRILGQSKIVSAKVRCTWVVTANNPRFSQEVARRAVQIRIDSGLARPQARTFKNPELERWVLEHRGQIVWSALTIIRAWVVANPRPMGTVIIGSFENWCKVMGGVLDVAGFGADFLGNREAFWSEHTDEESESLCTALEVWWNAFQETPVTAGELARLPVHGDFVPSTLADVLLDDEDVGKLTARGKATKVGIRLRRLERRVLCDYRIEALQELRQNRKQYVLRRG
jgi:putative DNA primase/helicase